MAKPGGRRNPYWSLRDATYGKLRIIRSRNYCRLRRTTVDETSARIRSAKGAEQQGAFCEQAGRVLFGALRLPSHTRFELSKQVADLLDPRDVLGGNAQRNSLPLIGEKAL
jgi:hypothetical protein